MASTADEPEQTPSVDPSGLRKEKYDPVTGELLAGSYDDHAAAVTSTAAELHRAGIGTGSASRPRSRTGSQAGTSSGRTWWCGRRRPGCR
ncbi:hypothetical protein [Streptomyces flavidovirens]|uniref:Uncharacterized protein n=1 Tax=Streptomyces flavidovirens TaxID=67298 RepID=A0ABW6RQ11_9ACTN